MEKEALQVEKEALQVEKEALQVEKEALQVEKEALQVVKGRASATCTNIQRTTNQLTSKSRTYLMLLDGSVTL